MRLRLSRQRREWRIRQGMRWTRLMRLTLFDDSGPFHWRVRGRRDRPDKRTTRQQPLGERVRMRVPWPTRAPGRRCEIFYTSMYKILHCTRIILVIFRLCFNRNINIIIRLTEGSSKEGQIIQNEQILVHIKSKKCLNLKKKPSK